jgi:hypothetical protein
MKRYLLKIDKRELLRLHEIKEQQNKCSQAIPIMTKIKVEIKSN